MLLGVRIVVEPVRAPASLLRIYVIMATLSAKNSFTHVQECLGAILARAGLNVLWVKTVIPLSRFIAMLKGLVFVLFRTFIFDSSSSSLLKSVPLLNVRLPLSNPKLSYTSSLLCSLPSDSLHGLSRIACAGE